MGEPKLGLATRYAYGETLAQLGRERKDIVALDADLSKSTQSQAFGKEFPDRFFNVGIAEANMVGIASGLALSGFIPFVSSFAGFLVAKAFDQMRISVAYAEVPVKFAGSHGGISIGEDGPSQMAIEDLALTLSLPGFAVAVPTDEHVTRKLVRQVVDYSGPAYLRLTRPKVPLVYDAHEEIVLGQPKVLKKGEDLTFIATGLLVWESLEASQALEKEGYHIGVVDVHTLRPLDEEILLDALRETRRIIVAEEHLLYTGLASVIAPLVTHHHPVPMDFIGLNNTYAESGTSDALLKRYGFKAPNLYKKALEFLKQGG